MPGPTPPDAGARRAKRARTRQRAAPPAPDTPGDVTALRTALAAHRQSEERLRLAQEAAQIVTWDWHVPADELVCSPYAAELFGLAPEELGSSGAIARLVHPDDLPGFTRAVQHALATGEPLSGEIRLLTPKGERWVLEQARPQRDEDGKVVRLLGAAHDITRRKQAEILLASREEQFRVLVENQAELVAKLDLDGRLSYVSPSFCTFVARPAEELLGTAAPFLVDGDANPATVLRRLVVPPHSLRFTRRVLGAHGWRWVSWSATGLLDERGQVAEILAVGRDTTERQRAEAALFEEKERAQVTLAAIADAVVRTDAAGRIDFLNPAAERLLGWSLPQAYGHPAEEVLQLLDEASGRAIESPSRAACASSDRSRTPARRSSPPARAHPPRCGWRPRRCATATASCGARCWCSPI